MLALKKKREAEAKKAAESGSDSGPEKVSLLGIGGKKTTRNGDNKTGGKKRTPGEIRIQKGALVGIVCGACLGGSWEGFARRGALP